MSDSEKDLTSNGEQEPKPRMKLSRASQALLEERSFYDAPEAGHLVKLVEQRRMEREASAKESAAAEQEPKPRIKLSEWDQALLEERSFLGTPEMEYLLKLVEEREKSKE